ncbi:hypothetical protein Tco_0348930 [Tanacetum coccineum]
MGVDQELKKFVEKLEIKLLGDLKENPTMLENFSLTVSSLTTQVSELKTLHLPRRSMKHWYTFAQAIESASHKAADQSVPSAGQAGTHPAEGEKNTR